MVRNKYSATNQVTSTHSGTRPRGQRCVLGLKRDIDKERVTYFDGQTDRRTNPVIEMRERQSNISKSFTIFFAL